jgi:hypothetical protein
MEKQSNIFNPSGCLRKEAMLFFLDNLLPEQDILLVQQHLESCELCRDAMEGFSMIPAEKRKKTLDMIGMHFQSKLAKRKIITRKMVFRLAAAIIVLLAGIFTVFRYSQVRMVTQITQQLKETKVSPTLEQESLDKSADSLATFAPSVASPTKMETSKKIPAPEVEDELSESVEEKPIDEPMAGAVPEKEEDMVAAESNKSIVSKEAPAARSSLFRNAGNADKKLSVERKVKDETTYYTVEQDAVFNNGDLSTFKKYVEEKINVETNSIYGVLTVTFTVDARGLTRDIYVVRGLNAKTDSLAVQIIKKSPTWKPARNGGKEVNQSRAVNLVVGKQ